jgi:hypothetical protein
VCLSFASKSVHAECCDSRRALERNPDQWISGHRGIHWHRVAGFHRTSKRVLERSLDDPHRRHGVERRRWAHIHRRPSRRPTLNSRLTHRANRDRGSGPQGPGDRFRSPVHPRTRRRIDAVLVLAYHVADAPPIAGFLSGTQYARHADTCERRLRDQMERSLPEYQRPSTYVPLGSTPRTTIQKKDTKQVASLAAELHKCGLVEFAPFQLAF